MEEGSKESESARGTETPDGTMRRGRLDTGLFITILGVLAVPLTFVLQANGVVTVSWILSLLIYPAIVVGFVWAFLKWEGASRWNPVARYCSLIITGLLLLAISSYGVIEEYRKEHTPNAVPAPQPARVDPQAPKVITSSTSPAGHVAPKVKAVPPSKVVSGAPSGLTSPDVIARVVGLKEPAIFIQNVSTVLAREAVYQIVLWNLDSTRDDSIPLVQRSISFIRAGEGSGPYPLTEDNSLPFTKPGDRLFGYLEVTCPECAKTKPYWVFTIYQHGGWYAEFPEAQFPMSSLIVKQVPIMRIDLDAWISQNVSGNRIPIVDF
jgi:hypothetical protein